MGNRAVITDKDKRIGIYLHWNGGRDSVEAFLKYCELKGYRAPSWDNYGWARLCQVIGNYFGGSTSIGIDTYDHLDTDNGDNGVYIIEGWEIVGRLYAHGEQMNYDLDEMLRDIDQAQPKDEQLGAYLDAIEVPTSAVQVGDVVYFDSIRGNPEPHEIVGIATEGFHTGPYAAIYDHDGDWTWNPNNFVHGETCRIIPRKTLEELEHGIEEILPLFV